MFDRISQPEPDKILRLMALFAADDRPEKIDLGVGVYRTAEGVTPIFRAVKAAEERIWKDQESKGYVSLAGDPAFHAALADLVLGEAVGSDRIAAIATPGGTGAVRQCFELIKRTAPDATVWLPEPSWPNHASILDTMEMPRRDFRYYDPETGGVDRAGMLEDLETVAPGDVVLLHGCCHNPTGADLTLQEWSEVTDILARRSALPMLDVAYLGFGAGLAEDAAGLRATAAALPEMLLAISGSKNFGLYRERVGCVLAVSEGGTARSALQETLAWLNRQAYAFPPDHGARIVTTILGDEALRSDWEAELDDMRVRVQRNREALAQALRRETGSDRFGYLAAQQGMFSLLGASPDEVERLREEHALYMVGDSRINLAGLAEDKIDTVAKAIAAVCR